MLNYHRKTKLAPDQFARVLTRVSVLPTENPERRSNPPHRRHDLSPGDPPLTAVPDGLDALKATIASRFELNLPLGTPGS
jgi:hypothetical protein